MRFASLGSGSRGNATLVEYQGTLVMIDCGFSCRETERRMARLGCHPAELAALLVTHEHGDHVRGVAPLARKYGFPVWLTHGTRHMLRDADMPGLQD
ncbi:MAG: MBL fold metallo-hydrolase, partial [Gammaproteobacteria bacterium]